jgi:hypothetical protein
MTDTERFSQMVTAQRQMMDRGQWTHGPVTLLEVLDLQHSEVHHCRVLRWLLDPLAHHGLGAAFMRALSTRLDLHLACPERARVDAEVPHARSRADVVIRDADNSWTVVIEAKINAAEGNLQAARLERDWPEPAKLVFLTRRGGCVPLTAAGPERWQALSWTWVIDTARDLLNLPLSGVKGESRARDARDAIATWVSAAERSIA